MSLDPVDGWRSLIGGDFTTSPVTINVNNNTQISTQLPLGLYEIGCDVDCYFTQGPSTSIANVPGANVSLHMLYGGTYRYLTASRANVDDYIAAATPSGTGSFKISKKGPVGF